MWDDMWSYVGWQIFIYSFLSGMDINMCKYVSALNMLSDSPFYHTEPAIINIIGARLSELKWRHVQ